MTTSSRCLVNGKHTPGSQWDSECPLNVNRVADRAAERERRAQAATPAQKAARAAAGERLRAARQARAGVKEPPFSSVRTLEEG